MSGRYEHNGSRADGLRLCPAYAASGAPCTRLGRINGRCWQHVPQEQPPPTLAPDGSALITAKCGTQFRVDLADYDDVARYKWTLDRSGYPRRWVLLSGRRPRSISIQRHLLGLCVGDGLVGDHINGDILDNRRGNLRTVTRNENAQNCRAQGAIRGVVRTGHRWLAQATLNNERHRIGTFGSAEEAAEAVHVWRLEHMPGYVDRPEARRSA